MPTKPRYHHSVFDYLAKLVWCTIVIVAPCKGAVYNEVSRLFDDKLGPNSSYKTTIRPLYNQSDVIEVKAIFFLFYIVEVNALDQKFVINGRLALTWRDEIMAWDRRKYKGVNWILPNPAQIWRPRMVLVNTIKERDLFEDKYSQLYMDHTGFTYWEPGGVYPASCKMNRYKYPFDVQECNITIGVITGFQEHVAIKPYSNKVRLDEYTSSNEWIIQNTSVDAHTKDGDSLLNIHFKLKRRPGFFIVNIVIPIVLLSFLNILVFIIPVDSGEKISYGVTVLLTLTVFMSIVSGKLPESSDPIPAVSIYLLILNIISLGSVFMSVVIVCCCHREEGELKRQNEVTSFKSLFQERKLGNHEAEGSAMQTQVNPDTTVTEREFSDTLSTDPTPEDQPDEQHVNRWKQMGNHLNLASSIVFPLIWLSVTIGFLVEIAG